jgi:hypothetical protein
LANVKADELQPGVINRAGWLLVGLTELSSQLQVIRGDAEYHRTHYPELYAAPSNSREGGAE